MTMTETQATRTNSIGIYIDRVDRNRILATLKAYNAIVESSDSTNQLAVQLFGIYDRLPIQNKIRCTKCKAVASKELDVCPFCGHDEGDDLPDVPEVGVVAGNGNGEGSNHEAHMTETLIEGTVKVKKKKKAAHGAESNGAGDVAVVVDDLQTSGTLLTERELDQAIRNVEKLKVDYTGCYWQIGRMIGEIHDQQLWKLRLETNEKGKAVARWKTWESFCNAELRMSPKSAGRAMNVSAQFSEDQVRLWGRSKLDLVLQAPVEARPALIEKIKAGSSKREVEEEVRKGKAESGFVRPSRAVDGRGGKTSETQTKGKQSTKIMVANILGSVTVKAYKKPASLKDVDWKEQARAKKLADQPIGVLELTNDVSMFIMLTESAAGELQYKVLTKRNAE
jgi:hypothetical protein